MTPHAGDLSTPGSASRVYHRPWAALAIAGVALLVTSALIAWLGGGGRISAIPPVVRVALDVAVGCVPLVAAAVLAAAIASRAGFGAATGISPWRLSDLGFGIGAGLALRAIVELIAPTTGAGLAGDGAGAIVAVVAAVAISPPVEEVFFRGLVQRAAADALSGAGRVVAETLAIALSTASFVLLHAIAAGAPGTGSLGAGSVGAAIGVGVGCGILTAVTRRLGAAIVAHTTFNAVGVVLLYA